MGRCFCRSWVKHDEHFLEAILKTNLNTYKLVFWLWFFTYKVWAKCLLLVCLQIIKYIHVKRFLHIQSNGVDILFVVVPQVETFSLSVQCWFWSMVILQDSTCSHSHHCMLKSYAVWLMQLLIAAVSLQLQEWILCEVLFFFFFLQLWL